MLIKPKHRRLEAEQHAALWLSTPGELLDYTLLRMAFAGPTTDNALHNPAQLTVARAHLTGKVAQNGKATQAQEANVLVHIQNGQNSLISKWSLAFYVKREIAWGKVSSCDSLRPLDQRLHCG